MRAQIINKYKIQWEDNYKKLFNEQGWDVEVIRDLSPADINTNVDVRLFMWADQSAVHYLNQIDDSRNIVFMRRYEYFQGAIELIPWSKVNTVISVNPLLGEALEKRINKKVTIIPNAVDIDAWKWRERGHGNKIAVVGYIAQKKNLSMALQILAGLNDSNYELHFAGGFQDAATLVYLKKLSEKMGLKVVFHGQVDNMDEWLDDKNYLLSCSISEGCPNNVIEAMAKGIKPIIHNWPGADSLFGPVTMPPLPYKVCENLVFNTIKEACEQISPESKYRSRQYRVFAKNKHGKDQYMKVLKIMEDIVK